MKQEVCRDINELERDPFEWIKLLFFSFSSSLIGPRCRRDAGKYHAIYEVLNK